nr:MAG TPA: hypothetical protein [Inoviridae sp.]
MILLVHLLRLFCVLSLLIFLLIFLVELLNSC